MEREVCAISLCWMFHYWQVVLFTYAENDVQPTKVDMNLLCPVEYL